MSETRVASGYTSPRRFGGIKRAKYVRMLEECPDRLRQMTLREVDQYLDGLVDAYNRRRMDLKKSIAANAGATRELMQSDWTRWWKLDQQASEAADDISFQEMMEAR